MQNKILEDVKQKIDNFETNMTTLATELKDGSKRLIRERTDIQLSIRSLKDQVNTF